VNISRKGKTKWEIEARRKYFHLCSMQLIQRVAWDELEDEIVDAHNPDQVVEGGDPLRRHEKGTKNNRHLCLDTVLRVRDVYPGSEFFPSRILIKEFKYFNPKNCFQALGNMIRVVHPGSGFLPIPDPGSRGKKPPDPGAKKAPDPGTRGQKGTESRIQGAKKAPDPGSATLLRYLPCAQP
jgi:hypothetical protein